MNSNGSKISCKRGFTLIELLVVVLIVGILAAVAVPQYKKAVLKTKLNTAISVVQDIRKAQELYGLENGAYSSSLEKLAIHVTLPAQMKVVESFLGIGILRVLWCPVNDIESCNMYQKRLATLDRIFDQAELVPSSAGTPGYKSCIYYVSPNNKEICDIWCEKLGGCSRISWGG